MGKYLEAVREGSEISILPHKKSLHSRQAKEKINLSAMEESYQTSPANFLHGKFRG